MRKLLLALTVLLTPLCARAEVTDPWTTWAGVGWLAYEQDEEQEPGMQYEIRQGYDLDDRWTVEAGFNGGNFYKGQNIKEGMNFEGGDNWSLGGTVAALYHIQGNPMVEGNPEGQIDPYAGVHGGARWYKREMDDDSNWVPNAGLQGGANYYLNDSWAVRGDYRLEVAGHDTEFNHHVMAYLGYRWGSSGDAEGDAASRAEGGLDREGLRLQTVYFPFDSSELTPAAREGLQKNAEYLKQNPNKKVVLEGHCDERGTNEYNLGLGQRRSQSAHEYLRSLGIEGERMETISYGEEQPAAQGSNEEAWAQNRRVECVVKE